MLFTAARKRADRSFYQAILIGYFVLFLLLPHVFDDGRFIHSHRADKIIGAPEMAITELVAQIRKALDIIRELFPFKSPLSAQRYIFVGS